MSHIILQNPHSGIIKKAPVGFSWTTLFFGPLPALFRSDFKWFFIQLLCALPLGIGFPLFAFIYNKIYIKKCLEAGYKVKFVEGASVEALNTKLGLELPLIKNRE